MSEKMRFGGTFITECHNRYGKLKWKDDAPNVVVDEGINHVLDIVFAGGSTVVDPWHIGIIKTTGPTVSSSETMSTHAGWVECTDYAESSREIWLDARDSQTLTNSTKAQFTIDKDNTTIGGAFLASGSTLGAAGVLMSGGAFTGGDKAADSGDVLSVTYTFSGIDDA